MGRTNCYMFHCRSVCSSKPSCLTNSNGFDTSRNIRLLNNTFPLSFGSFTATDAILFQQICSAVSTRSASLVATSTIALLQVNNELCKFPQNGRGWTSGSSVGTPSPSDSGLGSMDEEIRWSRRGSIFSAAGSRRGSLVSPNLLSVKPECGDESESTEKNHNVVMEEPTEMSLDDDDDDDDDVVVVAFCGSVMEKYHTFRERCQAILDELVQQPCPCPETTTTTKSVNGDVKVNGIDTVLRKVVEQRRVVLEENCDGGILGAGILAAVMDNKEFSDPFC